MDLQNVTPESLVRWVGAAADGSVDPALAQNISNLKAQLGRVEAYPFDLKTRLYCEVAAKYLPALVALFRQRPEAHGTTTMLIEALTTTPYFLRFLRSKAGAGIAALQAKRVAGAVDAIGKMSNVDVGNIAEFLSILFLLQGEQDVPAEDKAILLKHLTLWEGRLDRTFAMSKSARTCREYLEGRTHTTGAWFTSREDHRRLVEECVDKCGEEECERYVNPLAPADNMQRCSRCKCAVYCGPAHQKAAWRTHKPFCFVPTF